jgi:hypothetical protein
MMAENDTHAIMNDIVYIDSPGVAILDMQMSKVPIISGYVVCLGMVRVEGLYALLRCYLC